MAVNKVVFGDRTIMDISDSTVNANNLLSGVKAYGANGEAVTGAVTITEKFIMESSMTIDAHTELYFWGSDTGPDPFPNNKPVLTILVDNADVIVESLSATTGSHWHVQVGFFNATDTEQTINFRIYCKLI